MLLYWGIASLCLLIDIRDKTSIADPLFLFDLALCILELRRTMDEWRSRRVLVASLFALPLIQCLLDAPIYVPLFVLVVARLVHERDARRDHVAAVV